MKIGIYSDLHSNLPALEKVLERRLDADIWLCAGDTVGLFPFVNEVIDIQREMRVISVVGDHEYFLLSGKKMEHSFSGNESLVKQRKSITADNLKYLQGLRNEESLNLGGLKVHLSHYPTEEQRISMVKSPIHMDAIESAYPEHDLIVFGHTHIPLVSYGKKAIILNPGSLGFPVDIRRRPVAAIFDSFNANVEFLRFEIDGLRLLNAIDTLDYNPALRKYIENGYSWK